MSFNYEEAGKTNLIKKLMPALNKGLIVINPETLKLTIKTMVPWNTPWIYAGGDLEPEALCNMYHQVILPYYNFIPARCQECWKVVARPNTLTELFKVSDLQQESGKPSKAGIETRNTVNGLYGAYWYNNSLESGLECKDYIQKLMEEKIGDDINVFLKRGCTEFEHRFGDSTKWVVTEESERMEELLKENLVFEDFPNVKQPWYVVDYVKGTWVEWAYAHGDFTYANFTDGKPLYPGYIKYFSQKEYDEASHGV